MSEQRAKTIDRLVASFDAMPRWAKAACKHAMQAPTHHPETGKLFESFREVLEWAPDASLETLLFDFASNGDLIEEGGDACPTTPTSSFPS